ncbi:hypothetical protein niasHS_003632 [Heterodera schachtii]|uniref:C2 domain-containing protein n=1 Tax=Heterodera schachtii TaxID=97005 RepID=A0ABD2KH93_HETSC
MALSSPPFVGVIGGRGAAGRRGSAVSVLFPPSPALGAGGSCVANSLSPNSAYPAGFNPHRRRNSYAAGVLPELYVNEQNAGGRMSPATFAQQQQNYHHNGMAQQYGSQQHLLDPSAAYHRRRLPPTPLDLAEGRLSGSNETIWTEAMERGGGHTEGIIRRSSSPRVLPNPPNPQMNHSPVQWSSNGGGTENATTNVTSQSDWNDANLSPHQCHFARRPSSRRRRLPAEPIPQTQRNQHQTSFEGSLPPMAHREQQTKYPMEAKGAVGAANDGSANGGEGRGGQLLLRSSSTRSARGQHGRSPGGLPPAPRQQQSLETDNSAVNSTRAVSSLTDTTPGIGTFATPPSNGNAFLPPANDTKKLIGQNGENERTKEEKSHSTYRTNDLTSKQSECLIGRRQPQKRATNERELSVPVPTAALTPTPQKVSTVSAPTTPREMQQKEQKNVMNLANASNSRKFSSDSPSVLSDLAAISSLNLQRNGSGSMAHLLEQQHILRREFTTTPNSDGAVSVSDSAGGCARSNSSSLSPSIEQLNCTASVSRSGSDAEIVADPSILGFDPSLYTNGPSPLLPLSSTGGSFSGPSSSAHATDQPSTSALPCDDQPRPKGLGLIHCTLQHFPVRKRLRVNVLKIEGLAGELRPDLEIQPFCKLLLTPGKKQQQQSVVKRGRDAVFNQEFFFDGVATEEIDSKLLQIEVCHCSMQKLQKDQEIGEVRIPLKDITQQLHTKREVRIVEELKLFTIGKKLGKLHISTCIEREARRLTINLHKAEDLPKWGIIGAPDVQIRIRMQQGNGTEALKCSRVLKNTTTAVYKEAVMFLISTKETDLAQTKITISVHDLSRSVTGNDTIGAVFLGQLAIDKSEQDQWRNTMDHWGKEVKGVHLLKNAQGQATPEVHVVDVREEDEQGMD